MDNNEPNDAEYYKRIIEAGSRERLSNKALLRFIQDIRDETKSNIPKSWLGLLSKAGICICINKYTPVCLFCADALIKILIHLHQQHDYRWCLQYQASHLFDCIACQTWLDL